MDIKELEEIMVEHGVVLRAIPRIHKGIYETTHIDKFPNGKIEYLEDYKREMLVVHHIPDNGGKFLFECAKTIRTIVFEGKEHYETIEEAIEALLENKKENLK